MTREADVVRSLVEMADTLVDDYDVVDLLTGLTDRCRRGCPRRFPVGGRAAAAAA
jgi:hypothetical protein